MSLLLVLPSSSSPSCFSRFLSIDVRLTNDLTAGDASRSPPNVSPTRRLSPARRSSPSRQPRPREVLAPPQPSTRSPDRGRQRELVPRDEGRRRSPDKMSRPPVSDSGRRVASRDHSIDQRVPRQGVSSERGRGRRGESKERGDRRRSDRRSPDKERDRGSREQEIRTKRERGWNQGRDTRDRRQESRDRDSSKVRDGRERRDDRRSNRPRREPKQIVERSRNFKQMYSRDRRAASLETSDERDRRSSSNERRFSSTDRHSELRREIRYKKPYNRERHLSGDKRARLKRQTESRERLADSRDSLGESPNESWTSLEGSSSGGSNHVLDEPEDPRLEKRDRRYSSSPRRRSPERSRYSPSPRSPERRRSSDRHLEADFRHSPERWPRSSRSPQRRARARTPEVRRAESGSRVGPLVVTSEQLLSQKQRLRPVRPAALSDLTHIPEHSLNDISLILKTAITKRRDAFDEALSGRDSYRSDDMDWSDWH